MSRLLPTYLFSCSMAFLFPSSYPLVFIALWPFCGQDARPAMIAKNRVVIGWRSKFADQILANTMLYF